MIQPIQRIPRSAAPGTGGVGGGWWLGWGSGGVAHSTWAAASPRCAACALYRAFRGTILVLACALMTTLSARRQTRAPCERWAEWISRFRIKREEGKQGRERTSLGSSPRLCALSYELLLKTALENTPPDYPDRDNLARTYVSVKEACFPPPGPSHGKFPHAQPHVRGPPWDSACAKSAPPTCVGNSLAMSALPQPS